MKLTKLLFLTILTFSILSCSKDDDSKDTNDTSASLVGTWKATDFSYESTTRVEGQGTTIEQDATGVAKGLDLVIKFSESPKTFNVDSNYILEVTFENGGETTIQEYPQNYSGTGTWNKEGNTIFITQNSEETEATITELSETTLSYIAINTQTQTQSGVTTTVETTETFTFVRQ